MERYKTPHRISEKLRAALTGIGLGRSPEEKLQKERDAKRALAPSVSFDDEFLDQALREDIKLIEAFYSTEPNPHGLRYEMSGKEDEVSRYTF